MSFCYVPKDIKVIHNHSFNVIKKFEFSSDFKRWSLENEIDYFGHTLAVTKEVSENINEESNTRMIMSFFESLQTIGFKFEDNQKKLLVAGMNTLTLGRSGTGKTTMSTFKILSLQLLFVAYAKKTISQRDNVKLNSRDIIEGYKGIAVAFVTASPVLTNEVR